MSVPPLSRQQRRRLRRDLTERGARALERGLPRQMSDQDALGIALMFRGILDGGEAGRASDLAVAAEAVLERTLSAETRGLEIACGKGCGYCCSALVTCTAPEILAVARHLRAGETATLIATVAAEGAAKQGLGEMDLLADKRPCPLLIDKACSVYAVRPLPCRTLFSMSAESCRAAMIENKGEVPVLSGPFETAERVRMLMLAAVESRGLETAGYDLAGGLAQVLEQPDAEARWLAGENVMAGVRSMPRSPQARAMQVRLAARIAELAD